jgi:hypothetical protein
MLTKKFEPCYLLSPELLPEGFQYPQAYLDFFPTSRAADLLDGEPWTFFDVSHLAFRSAGLKERYPERTLVPFAIRQHSDDIACFDGTVGTPNPPVVLIHDMASSGWEHRDTFPTFEEWLRMIEMDIREWREAH